MASPSNNRNRSARLTGGKAGGRAGKPSNPVAGTKDKTVRVPKEWNAKTVDHTNNRGSGQRPTGGQAGGRAGKPSGSIARPAAGTRPSATPKPSSTTKPPAGAATPSTPGRMNRAARSLVGTKARAIGATASIASSALTGDAKGAAITGGTYAAGRLLQALPNPGAKIAGKVVEAAAPFTPGLVNALSSGSGRPQSRTSNTGSRSKADTIGKNGARPLASRFESAYDPPGDTRANYGLEKAPPAPKLPAPVTRSSSGRSGSTQSGSGSTPRRSGSSTPARPSAPASPAKPGQKFEDFNPNRGTSKSNNPLLDRESGGIKLRDRMKAREDSTDKSAGPAKDGKEYGQYLNRQRERNDKAAGPTKEGNVYGDYLDRRKKNK